MPWPSSVALGTHDDTVLDDAAGRLSVCMLALQSSLLTDDPSGGGRLAVAVRGVAVVQRGAAGSESWSCGRGGSGTGEAATSLSTSRFTPCSSLVTRKSCWASDADSDSSCWMRTSNSCDRA